MRDVVVVGAGHNGLVAACYLAREGLDVEVVERDTVAGGAVSTVQPWPGYRVDRGSSVHVMVRHTGIVDDLGLDLTYQDLDPWAFAPFPDGNLEFFVDLARTCESIAALCGPADADAYAAFVDDWGERNRRVFEAFQQPPTLGRLGRALWGLGKGSPGLELARQFLQPGDALLDAHFRDERLKTALAWLGAQSGPPTHEVATADLVGWNTVMHRLAPGHPVGGSGALSQALAARLASYGGSVRLGDGAARITCAGNRVNGVVTESGEHVAARHVVAACHVLTTVGLLGDDALAADTARRVRVGNGIGMAVRLGTSALPGYPGAGPAAHRGMQLLCRSREQLRGAHGEFCAGRPPSDPPVLVMALSALDDTLAPPGRHTVTLWGQWHPYALSTGEDWAAVGEREGQRLVRAVESYAPGFAQTVEHVWVQTPRDIEGTFGMHRGNVMHVEMGLDAMFALRPLPEWAAYRGPRAGLYLCGASTHPGGGVFGASGRSAARALLRDRRPRWLRPARLDRRGGRPVVRLPK